MEIIKGITGFYMQNPILNTVIVLGVLVCINITILECKWSRSTGRKT